MKRRTKAELQDEAGKLCDMVWYNRSFSYSDEEWLKHSTETKAAILKARARIEEESPEVLEGWDDFEWGMVNGKLSAVRWALGDDWDFLDT